MLHGDFHPLNIMIKKDDTAVVIDFMNVCCEPILYDIARTYCLLKEKNQPFALAYLEKMDTTEEMIRDYIRVIEACREFER